MADTSQQRTAAPAASSGSAPSAGVGPARGAPPAEPTGWTGWVLFAGVMLLVLGGFHVIEGLVALFHKGYYVVSPSGLVINVSYTGWGWTHIILGGVGILIGLGLMAGNMAARVGGVILAVVSAIVNMAFLAAYPVWSAIMIGVDLLVIYAIVVHGRELKA